MNKNKFRISRPSQEAQSGFITMIVIMLVVIGTVLYFAYKRVSAQ